MLLGIADHHSINQSELAFSKLRSQSNGIIFIGTRGSLTPASIWLTQPFQLRPQRQNLNFTLSKLMLTPPMKIPHSNLSLAALKEVVEEFVTRDGTDHSAVKRRVTDVLEQLENGLVELHFDSDTGTCNIVAVST